MAFYRDLTDYTYHGGMFSRLGTRNVGWLGLGHQFNTAEPSQEFLSKLWTLCKISVAQTRGMHKCELCRNQESHIAERNNERLLLGSAEVRAFSDDGRVYAAPTLVYHYVDVHKYKPPEEFVEAVVRGPLPPDPEYFERLNEQKLEWRGTIAPGTRRSEIT